MKRIAIVYIPLFILLVTGIRLDNTAQAQEEEETDLTELSLEELMNIEVTSVSKREESLFDAPSAIYVITGEDIRRSGVRSIPEALRMVPGVNVAQINANEWAISIRGFNNRFANKLLVLVDGRSVYDPLFAGVYWEELNTILEDIDRIEVIRGPGGTLWGSNAVNGVINIITKSAEDTQGGYVNAGGGNEEQGFVDLRYGRKLKDDLFYRAYGKFFNRDSFADSAGGDANDNWKAFHGGFRVDWDVSTRDTITFLGNTYRIDVDSTETVPLFVPPFSQDVEDEDSSFGGSLLARWIHVFSDTSDMALQVYYDITDRELFQLDDMRHTVDLDFLHHFRLGSSHDIVWGIGYRLITDDTDGTFILFLEDESRTDNLISAFIQDEITLIRDRLYFTVGSKFEHNDFTGFEVQPSGRLHWTPHERHALWAAVSRAVRIPSRVEDSIRLSPTIVPDSMGGPPMLLSIIGNPDFKSEELLALELGYRVQPVDWVFIDVATFLNFYDNLNTVELGDPFFVPVPIPHVVVPVVFDNRMDGKTYGVEIATTWNPVSPWTLMANYSFLQMDLEPDESSGDIDSEGIEDQSPAHQVQIRSLLNLPFNLEFDAALYYVSRLSALDVPGYTRLDLRLGWKPIEELDVSIVAQNLLDDEHLEFSQTGIRGFSKVERSIYGAITWRFGSR